MFFVRFIRTAYPNLRLQWAFLQPVAAVMDGVASSAWKAWEAQDA